MIKDENSTIASPRPAKRMKMHPAQERHVDGCLSVASYRYKGNNVFARMTTRLLPVELLFEQPHTFALLDERPISRGHALLVVKHAAATLLEAIPAACLADTFRDLQVLLKAVQTATQCQGVKVLQNNGPAAGQTVPQIHFHVVPVYTDEPMSLLLTDPARPKLNAVDNGQLIARIRNLLPKEYAPGCHVWAQDAEGMEKLGMVLQQQLGAPGRAFLLHGHLGSGKSTIARGFVRAAMRNACLDVPSPTFLLCLSYQEDLAHDAHSGEGSQKPLAVHHMDPYRLGTKVDKMAGLIDFEKAFSADICLIEWPDRMPQQVMQLSKQGVAVHVSGTGVQATGRHVRLLPLGDNDPCAEVIDMLRTQGLPEPHIAWSDKVESALGPNGALPPHGAAGKLPSGVLVPLIRHPSTVPQSSWLVLGIESSCDDTAAAVVKGDGSVLAHKIASQAGLHEQYGGIKPDVARDAHSAAIHQTVAHCLKAAGVKPQDLTAIAVTVGPGLSLCLQVGVEHALQLAAQHCLPLVPVHHMEAHVMMTRLPSLNPRPMSFPALVLLVSGGHNLLVLCEGVGRHRIMGTTLDDSVGECFDKIARMFGIAQIPGGPHLEKLAIEGEALLAAEVASKGQKAGDAMLAPYSLKMPMQTGVHRESCNFSFSGLKTQVMRLVEQEKLQGGQKEPHEKEKACNASAEAAVDADRTSGGILNNRNVDTGPCAGVHDVAVDVPAPESSADEGGAPCSSEADRQLHRAFCLTACSFQRVAVAFLQQRTRRALQWLKEDAHQQGGDPVTCLVVAGGVAANKTVRAGLEAVAAECGVPCVCPPIQHCMDNGLMVAWTGVERLAQDLYCTPPHPDSFQQHIEVLPRWPIGPLDPRSASASKYVKAFH